MFCRSTNVLMRPVALTFAVALAAVLTAIVPVVAFESSGGAAWAETQKISDGATATAPDEVRVDGSIEITGKRWTALAGGGSVIAIKLDDGDIHTRTSVANPLTADPIADPSVVAAVRASPTGSFKVSVPVPEAAGWTAGTRHSVRLLTGRLLSDDATRSVALSFDLTAAPVERSSTGAATSAAPTPGIAASPSGSAFPSGPAPTRTKPTSDSSTGHAASPAPSPGSTTSTASPPSASGSTAASGMPVATTSSTPSASARHPIAGATPGDRPSESTQRMAAREQAAAGPVAGAKASAVESTPVVASSCDDPPMTWLSSQTTTRGVSVADLGGSLALTGTGFCHPKGGGSLIAIQIDDGQVVRRDSTVDSDRTIWQVVEADDAGSFSTTVRIPEAHQTDPEFADGAHRLRLLTGSLRVDDAVRSLHTAEFVVASNGKVGTLPEPTSHPRPVKAEVALVGSKAEGVTAARTGSTVRIVVPQLEPGDWVFPYAYGATGSEAQPIAWMQLDANRSVVLDAADLEVKGSPDARVSLQTRDGTMVGWVPVAAPAGEVGAPMPAPAPGPAATQVSPSVREHTPRPLVLAVGGFLLLVGLVSLGTARAHRRRLLRELNGG